MAKKKNDMEEKLYNLQAQQLAAQVANWAAQLDFQKERFRLLELPQFQQGLQLDVDRFAWQKAQDTWQRAYQESLLTGTYNGQPTTQWLMDQARLTGSFNGERTLEGRLTDSQIEDMKAKMKLANDEFLSATTGYFNGQKTFDRQKFEAAQALEGWKFISTLSGPQNAFKQARAIASAPGGLADIMRGFAGQYMVGAGGAVGSGGAGYGAGQLNDMMAGFTGLGGPGGGGTGIPITGPGGGSGAVPPAPVPGGIAPSPAPTPGGSPTTVGTTSADYMMGPGGAGGGGGGAADYMVGPGGDRAAAAKAAYDPTFMNPVTPAPVSGPIPGQGIYPTQWDEATRAAVAAWNAANPSYAADGSRLGWQRSGVAPTEGPGPGGPYPGDYGYVPHPGQMPYGYSYSPPGVQAPPGAYNYSANANGSTSVYPPGVASPPDTADVSSNQPMNPLLASGVLNQPYQYSPPPVAPATQTSPGMIDPSRINAENYSNMYQFQKDLGWAAYEDAGYDKGLAQEAFLRSLPKYGGPARGSIRF